MAHALLHHRQKMIRIAVIIFVAALLMILLAFINKKEIADQSKTSVIDRYGVVPLPMKPEGRYGVVPLPMRPSEARLSK